MADNTPDPFAPYSGLGGTAEKRQKARHAQQVAQDYAEHAQAQEVSDSGPYDEYKGKKYKFTDITGQDRQHNVEDYTAQGKVGDVPVTGTDEKWFQGLKDILPSITRKDEGGVGHLEDPGQLSEKEYDALTKQASKGNKLAQEILLKGHYKAHDFPSLTQDLNKVEDPFVKALSNMPNVANTAESQIAAVTQPYDFANAEGQVNAILANQGFAQTAQPSAQTSAYVNKIDQIASGNPLTSSALGLPPIDQALAGLGPAAKASEKAAPNAALLAALLSHIQYQDVYGTGLSASQTANNPAWLQQLIAAVTNSTFAAGLPNASIAAAGAGTTPSAGSSPVPNTG